MFNTGLRIFDSTMTVCKLKCKQKRGILSGQAKYDAEAEADADK